MWVLTLANVGEYGLSACIRTRDADRAIRVARRLEAGHICINDWAGIDDFLEYQQVLQVFHRGWRLTPGALVSRAR